MLVLVSVHCADWVIFVWTEHWLIIYCNAIEKFAEIPEHYIETHMNDLAIFYPFKNSNHMHIGGVTGLDPIETDYRQILEIIL